MKYISKYHLVVFAFLLDFALFAQPGSGGNGVPVEGVDPEPAPIDSTLIILAVIGIAYILNIYRSKKTV